MLVHPIEGDCSEKVSEEDTQTEQKADFAFKHYDHKEDNIIDSLLRFYWVPD